MYMLSVFIVFYRNLN